MSLIFRSFASWTEAAVGASLIAIGALGIKEARAWDASELSLSAAHNSEVLCPPPPLTSSHGLTGSAPSTLQPGDKMRRGTSRAILFNGLLHGFSVDGTPSLAPALALPSVGALLAFLLAYTAGSVVAMGALTTIIGEGTLQLGESMDQVRSAL